MQAVVKNYLHDEATARAFAASARMIDERDELLRRARFTLAATQRGMDAKDAEIERLAVMVDERDAAYDAACEQSRQLVNDVREANERAQETLRRYAMAVGARDATIAALTSEVERLKLHLKARAAKEPKPKAPKPDPRDAAYAAHDKALVAAHRENNYLP